MEQAAVSHVLTARLSQHSTEAFSSHVTIHQTKHGNQY